MPRPYSMDLRERVLAARGEGMSQAALAERFQVSEHTIYTWLRRYREEGTVAPKPHGGGQAPAVDRAGEAILRQIVEAESDATLADYRVRYHERTGVRVSRSALSRTLQRLRITRKKRRSKPPSRPVPMWPKSARRFVP